MHRKFHLVSLGCPKNRVDSEVAAFQLIQAGYEQVAEPQDADLIVVNTCGFIEEARKESINTLLEMAQIRDDQQRPIRVVAMGCLAQYVGKELAEAMPELDVIAGTGVVDILPRIIESGEKLVLDGDKYVPTSPMQRVRSQSPAFAYLKIGDGCNRRCAFCTIPLFKGPYASRPVDAIVEEAQALAAEGVREVVLVSQDFTQYGAPGNKSVIRLMDALARRSGIPWIRVMYAYPEGVDAALTERLCSGGPFVPYLDLPFQHVDDGVLRLMRRGTTEASLRHKLDWLRTVHPELALRTTFIVGFPGEDEEAFAKLEKVVAEYRFEHMGVFQFSPEDGTPAATMKSRPTPREAASRANRLMKLQKNISRFNLRRLVGTTRTVLVDGVHPEYDLVPVGRISTQAPEVDGMVILDGYEGPVGSFVQARIVKHTDYDLVAQVEESE